MAAEGTWKKDRGERLNEQWLQLRRRYELIRTHLDEQSRRRWAGAEALAIGSGGIAVVSEACKMSPDTVRRGLREVQEGGSAETAPGLRRIRRPGGGRKRQTQKDPGLLEELEKLVNPATRGDPESPLRWTSKSLRKLAEELTSVGHAASVNVVSGALRELKYSLQANRKTREGKQHADRDAQFHHIAAKATTFLAAGEPVISVDTKKKEKIGEYKNGGREYEPRKAPRRVRMHDFGDRDAQGRVQQSIPYGVYDQGQNVGWVSVGIDHDTAAFAVATIAQWWAKMGQRTYPQACRVLITADSGGSNGNRVRAWKAELQKLADQTGLEFHVCHFPPGTSKWNKIEHRMFSQITLNWRGRPLTSHETVVNLIANTTTRKGLRIQAALDASCYPLGVKVPKRDMDALNIERGEFHPEWNYAIHPRPADQQPPRNP